MTEKLNNCEYKEGINNVGQAKNTMYNNNACENALEKIRTEEQNDLINLSSKLTDKKKLDFATILVSNNLLDSETLRLLKELGLQFNIKNQFEGLKSNKEKEQFIQLLNNFLLDKTLKNIK